MKIALQYHYPEGRISGVKSYVVLMQELLMSNGIEAVLVNSHELSFLQQLKAISGSDLVMMNSPGNLAFALFVKLLRVPLVMKFHYPFFMMQRSVFVDASIKPNFRRKVLRELYLLVVEILRLPMKWKVYRVLDIIRFISRVCCLALSDSLLSCSEFIARDLEHTKVKTDYSPHPRELEIKVEKNTNQFCYVGRLSHSKAVDTIIEASRLLAEKNQKFQVCIIGDGESLGELEGLVAKYNLENQITFKGMLPREECMRIMAESIAIIVPSRWPEPGAYVLFEAGTVSTAVFASKSGGNAELVGGGKLFEIDDMDTLANYMLWAIENPEECVGLGVKNHLHITAVGNRQEKVKSLISHIKKKPSREIPS